MDGVNVCLSILDLNAQCFKEEVSRQNLDEVYAIIECWQSKIVLVCGIHDRLFRIYR